MFISAVMIAADLLFTHGGWCFLQMGPSNNSMFFFPPIFTEFQSLVMIHALVVARDSGDHIGRNDCHVLVHA